MSVIQGRISKDIGKILLRLEEVQKVYSPVLATHIAIAALEIHREAVKSIASHMSGKHKVLSYRPGSNRKRRRFHLVSEPGFAPNQDLGTLTRSIKFEIDAKNMVGIVGTNLKYGRYLEMGTGRMAARPWLRPAFEKHIKTFQETIFKSLKYSSAKRGA